MKIVSWSDWLDQHIPYYQVEKQKNRYADNPPEAILIVDPVDRNRRVNHRGFAWSTWEVMDNDIRKLNYQAEPIFLDNDTHQRWYWAFASQKEALMAIIKLS
jgi:hypothetical protein